MFKDKANELIENSYLLLINKPLLNRLGKNARFLAENKLNWNNLVTELNNFYYNLT